MRNLVTSKICQKKIKRKGDFEKPKREGERKGRGRRREREREREKERERNRGGTNSF